MKGHHRRIGKFVTILREQLENRVFASGIAPISFEHERERRQPIALFVGQRRADIEEEFEAAQLERLARAHDDSGDKLCAMSIQPRCGLDLPLQ